MPDDNAVQATVVLHLLGRSAAYPRADLAAALEGIAHEQFAAALVSLAEAGVVQVGPTSIRATDALRRLDELGLIAL